MLSLRTLLVSASMILAAAPAFANPATHYVSPACAAIRGTFSIAYGSAEAPNHLVATFLSENQMMMTTDAGRNMDLQIDWHSLTMIKNGGPLFHGPFSGTISCGTAPWAASCEGFLAYVAQAYVDQALRTLNNTIPYDDNRNIASSALVCVRERLIDFNQHVIDTAP